jgi:hypothetical protein
MKLMLSVEENWNNFKENVVLKSGATKESEFECKKIYYAGCYDMLEVAYRFLKSEEPDLAALRSIIEEMFKETHGFFTEILQEEFDQSPKP